MQTPSPARHILLSLSRNQAVSSKPFHFIFIQWSSFSCTVFADLERLTLLTLNQEEEEIEACYALASSRLLFGRSKGESSSAGQVRNLGNIVSFWC